MAPDSGTDPSSAPRLGTAGSGAPGPAESSGTAGTDAFPATWAARQSVWDRLRAHIAPSARGRAGRTVPATSLRHGAGGEGTLDAGDEVVEHVPWDRITIDEPAGRSPAFYLVAAVGVILAAVAIWQFQGPDTMPTPITLAGDPSTSPGLASVPVDEPAAIESEPVDADADRAVSARVAELDPSAPLTSEADLMAFVPIDGEDAARVRAEWFVLDYFSTSDAARAEKVSVVVPDWAEIEFEPTAAAYVDWVNAYDVSVVSDGRFDVTVAYRTLITPDEGPYRTGVVRAVVVPIAVRSDGSSSVAGLPTPSSPPKTLSETAGENPHADDRWELAEPPAEVADAALETVSGLVGNPTVIAALTDGDGWRLVVEGEAGGGVRWPFEVRVDPSVGLVPAEPVEGSQESNAGNG